MLAGCQLKAAVSDMICVLNWKCAVQQKGSSAFSTSLKALVTGASDCPWEWARVV